MKTDFSEDELIPLSALQHYAYCPRQCALIHIEQQWSENRFTAEGRVGHQRVDKPESETRGDTRMEYAVPLRSLTYGVTGKADVIEYHRSDAVPPFWQPYPVEHKRGRPKPDRCDEVQLCAQAFCIEEMLACSVPQGAIFYGQPRRRHMVAFSEDLRTETMAAINAVRELLDKGNTPPPVYERKKCDSCSLKDICIPDGVGESRSAAKYLLEALD
ncbi:MAG: CRISPR-associated protein Cas4 [Verrucomicrobia bacterium]|nr:CRISPR-associated protein Cas4 [Verrucomicrobiota bacterium]